MNNFNSSIEAFLYWEKETPNNPFLIQNFENTQQRLSYDAAGSQIRKLASYLTQLGLPKKSHIALLSKNCPHWIMADLAISMAGFISIPIYPTLTSEGINQILIHSESKAIIIGKLDDFASQKEGIPNIPLISVEAFGGNSTIKWEDIMEQEEELTDFSMPKSEDLRTIIYTSGTTGQPKGVMHTSGNFTKSSSTFTQVINLPKNPKFFSYLPLAHVAERAFCNGILFYGGQITFPYSLETFAENLEKLQPDIFFGVPRIWTKFQEKILESLPQRKLSLLLSIPFINKSIKKKIQTKLGLSNASFIASAAAPISSSLVKWYITIGITIQQAYGMTEDCCISHTNLSGQSKIGTVGKSLEGVKIKFSEEGEILILNNCLFKGYYKAPEITAAVFDEEGYFKTGDIGEYDHEGYLTITGRVKDQFKTDKGKYISPAPIELQISKNTDIEQICVVGTGIPQPIALVTVSSLGRSKNKEDLGNSLYGSIMEINPSLQKHEKIAKVVVMPEEWNVANGFTTPTLKIKRSSLERVFQPLYKIWFDADQNVIFKS
ncbi:AMP-binding protein [Arenibacter sp. F20364]|uniref:AMP-binding protein n=1 Tax=Arenibacter sp. F20364 TaxID=2926415 RepID=UPI001FF36596|nr:AMP-binding protein [Arenibacter sp. F20364]MCK0190168.1 AMP-binding protein [Arenibacter sp. F20364]